MTTGTTPANALDVLEAGYWDQPAFGQKADLVEINRLRALRGLPLVDARLRPMAVEVATSIPAVKVPDHTAARALYRAYLRKYADLILHQQYADRVCRATSGPGMTPVEPLATMGTGGNQLLCDHCNKPIPLEGGRFQGVPAGTAWAQNPVSGWKSYISGGVVMDIETNGTLRVYHGHLRDGCCKAATDAREMEWAAFKSAPEPGVLKGLYEFLRSEHPDWSADDISRVIGSVSGVMFGYDPGIGINRPSV